MRSRVELAKITYDNFIPNFAYVTNKLSASQDLNVELRVTEVTKMSYSQLKRKEEYDERTLSLPLTWKKHGKMT